MRLFIAVPIPGRVADLLAESVKPLQKMKNIHLIPKQNLHCTTLFLGEKTKPESENIMRRMIFLRDRFSAAEISLHKLVFFPTANQAPRVLAAAVKSAHQGLHVYHRILIREFGMKSGSSANFSPHITLARFHGSGRKCQPVIKEEISQKISQKVILPEISFFAESIVLYSSSLSRKGASYDPVFTIKLGL